jgi:ubiquinone/menaquinone biosynthesis C-methylase UbiE
VLDFPLRWLFASPGRTLARFGFRAGSRVVEIGCGTGYYSVEAARRVGPNGRLICLDVQEEMLAATRRRLMRAGVRNVRFVEASAERIPLPSQSVDHVFMITVLGEIADRAGALGEIHRVLMPGGRLSIGEQLPDPDFVRRGTLRRELAEAGFVEDATRGLIAYTSNWHKPDDDAPGGP